MKKGKNYDAMKIKREVLPKVVNKKATKWLLLEVHKKLKIDFVLVQKL